MGLRVANGPVSWGVDLPDKPGAPPWDEVFTEISEAGYLWCELGPVGYLPDDAHGGGDIAALRTYLSPFWRLP